VLGSPDGIYAGGRGAPVALASVRHDEMPDIRPATPARVPRITGIDGLRAVAMSLVVAEHCEIIPFGWAGVWVFFVISGFVITLSLTSEISASRPRPYQTFLARRARRILPIYLLYVAINIGLMIATGTFQALWVVPSLLTFTYNWQRIYQILDAARWIPIGHLWSLSIEEQFYILFPFLMLYTRARRLPAIMVGLLIAGPIIRGCVAMISSSQSTDLWWMTTTIYASTACQFDAFIFGALLAVLLPQVKRNRRIATYLWTTAIVFGLVYSAVYCTVNYGNGERGLAIFRRVYSGALFGEGREIFVYTSVSLLAASVLTSILIDARWVRVLKSPALVHVGRVSYGGYMYHPLVVMGIEQLVVPPIGFVARLVVFIVVWTTTVTLATLSYRFVELPFMSGGRSPRPLGASGI
jgi:peptidoglycan/LPS O-acetylase OafA/YrhL